MEKVVLITGASRGIGAAMALSFGNLGYRVAVHYRGGEKEANELCHQLPEAKPYGFDLSEQASCKDLCDQVKKDFGRIDVLINNAGMSIDQMVTFAKPEDFAKLIDVNLKPVFLLSKFVSKVMIKQKDGVLINMSSVVGHTGNLGQSMYAATKAGITGFTKSIAQDLAGFGIRANCIAPGFIKTAMTDALDDKVKEDLLSRIPLKRLGTPEDVAGAALFLASDQARYITGSTIHVNGGMFTS